MATVDSWFAEFALRHTERFPRGDWPGADSVFWEEFKAMLVKRGVTRSVADEASRAMFEAPPEFVSEHPAAFLASVRAIWRGKAAQVIPAATRSAANDWAWESAAAAHWESLSEADRDEWRTLVSKRARFFARTPKFHELLATAWAYDPSFVLPDSGQRESRSTSVQSGPRRLFDPSPQFTPFEKKKGT